MAVARDAIVKGKDAGGGPDACIGAQGDGCIPPMVVFDIPEGSIAIGSVTVEYKVLIGIVETGTPKGQRAAGVDCHLSCPVFA